jgi:hypothetical protein
VELYINNVLIDYKADANGFFPLTLPLMYGVLKFHCGIMGLGAKQFFSNQFVVLLFPSKKEIEYGGFIEDGRGDIFTNAKVNYGLSIL